MKSAAWFLFGMLLVFFITLLTYSPEIAALQGKLQNKLDYQAYSEAK